MVLLTTHADRICIDFTTFLPVGPYSYITTVMDSRTRHNDDKTFLREEIVRDVDGIAQTAWPSLRYPLKLIFHIFSAAFRLVKPFAPQLIPLVVFLLTIPIIVFLSLSSGWFVWRSIAVGWETDLNLQYGYVHRSVTLSTLSLTKYRDGIPPYARFYLQNVVAQQPYDVSLHLVVPASEANFALGNFMTTLTFATHANRTLVSVRKPVGSRTICALYSLLKGYLGNCDPPWP